MHNLYMGMYHWKETPNFISLTIYMIVKTSGYYTRMHTINLLAIIHYNAKPLGPQIIISAMSLDQS